MTTVGYSVGKATSTMNDTSGHAVYPSNDNLKTCKRHLVPGRLSCGARKTMDERSTQLAPGNSEIPAMRCSLPGSAHMNEMMLG